MNWKRGFFRIWMLASVLWCSSLLVWNLDHLRTAMTYWSGNSVVVFTAGKVEIEVPASMAIAEVEALVLKGIKDGKVEVEVVNRLPDSTTALNAVKDYILGVAKLRRVAADARNILLAMIVVPLVMLALGGVFGWVVRGFRST